MREPVPGRVAVYVRSMLIRILLGTLGLRAAYLWIWRDTRHSVRPIDPSGDALARRIAAAVTAVNESYALRRVPCLEESLCLWWFLRHAGLDADLRMGVRKLTGRFESHAWVEYQGTVLNDASDVAHVYPPLDLTTEAFRATRG